MKQITQAQQNKPISETVSQIIYSCLLTSKANTC